MRNAVRALLLVLLVLPVVLWWEDFHLHVVGYLSGHAINRVIREQWHVVAASILFFVAFLVPITWRRKARWTEYGMVAAFFVSLFVEMFGIPLTLLFASRFLPAQEIAGPTPFLDQEVWGVGMRLTIPMAYGLAVTLSGALIIAVGWFQLYRAVREERVVTSGVYALSRHPQYVGFLMVLFGWLVGWPTFLTLLMVPILMVQYVRVCLKEEAELDPQAYATYRAQVPMFL